MILISTESQGVSVMSPVKSSFGRDGPPPSPSSGLFTSPSPHLTHPTVALQPRPSDEISPTLCADIFRLLFCCCGWHRWAPVSSMARLQSAAPCQVRPRSCGNRGTGMGLTVLCCTCFALTTYPPASPAILPLQRTLLPSQAPAT